MKWVMATGGMDLTIDSDTGTVLLGRPGKPGWQVSATVTHTLSDRGGTTVPVFQHHDSAYIEYVEAPSVVSSAAIPTMPDPDEPPVSPPPAPQAPAPRPRPLLLREVSRARSPSGMPVMFPGL